MSRRSRRAAELTFYQEGAAAARQAKDYLADTAQSHWQRWGEKTLLATTCVATAGSLVFIGVQSVAALDAARAAADQAAAATQTLNAQLRANDHEFLASVTLDIATEGIVIKNSALSPLSSTAYWFLQSTDGWLDEVEGGIAGIAACSRITIPWNFLETAKPDAVDGEDSSPFVHDEPDLEELHLALQAPSGQWYLKGASGSLYSIEPHGTVSEDTHRSAQPSTEPGAIVSYAYEATDEGVRALHSAEPYRVAPDTYWGGADGVNVYAAKTIVNGDAITVGAFTPGLQTEPVDCR